MTMSLTSPVTGGAVSGVLTSPTYALVSDIAPDTNGRQYAVSTLGGTQPNVLASLVSRPFTVTMVRPKQFKVLGAPQLVTGQYSSVPRNTYKVITRKAVGLTNSTATGQSAVMVITTTYDIPAGADSGDPNNIAAAISLHHGATAALTSDLFGTVTTGTF